MSRTLKIKIRFDNPVSAMREADIKKVVAELKESVRWLSGTVTEAELGPEESERSR